MQERPWCRPLRDRRCRAVREPRKGSPYHGRCELKAGHDGPHALERGFDTPTWSTDWLPPVVLPPARMGSEP